MLCLLDLSHFEAELLNARIGEGLLDGGEQAFFFERKLLHHQAVGDGDFEHAAAYGAGFGDGRKLRAGDRLPRGSACVPGADLSVALALDDLSDYVGHALGLPAVEAAALELAAAIEFVQVVGREINHEGTKDTKCGGEYLPLMNADRR
jgi:hypothetical protein